MAELTYALKILGLTVIWGLVFLIALYIIWWLSRISNSIYEEYLDFCEVSGFEITQIKTTLTNFFDFLYSKTKKFLLFIKSRIKRK